MVNTGDTYLNNLNVVDADLGIDRKNMIKVSGDEPLEPKGTMIFYYETTVKGDLLNTVVVSGTPTDVVGNVIPNTYIQKDDDTTEVEALGNIGNYIWNDKNHDGVQDPDEEVLSNVKVILIDLNGKETEIFTDSDGKYLFDNLVKGKYTLKIDLDTLPENLKATYELDENLDNSVEVDLRGGESRVDVDFGYSLKQNVKDSNNNGKAKGEVLPKTGSPIDFIVLIVLGLILIVSGAVFVVKNSSKNKIS